MKKTVVLTFVLFSLALAARENRPSDFRQQELEILAQPFSLTNNTAGMGLSQPSSGSKSQIRLFNESGDFHLAQQGESDKGFSFSTLRYDTFSDKLFMRGAFCYSLDRESDRKWSDVIDPWFSIPYIYGSAIAKDYDRHDCALVFDLYTAPLSDWISVGIKTDYRVSDISGMRDPRPRTGYLNYQLIPSVLATLGSHHLGLDLGYGYSKEKLSNLTTIQSYPNLYYYKMSGLEHVDGAIAGYSGFKRQFVGNRFIGDISYGYENGPLNVLVSGGLEYEMMNAYGDKLQQPGSFNRLEYNGLVDATLDRGPFIQNLRIEGRYKDGGADEYLQELVSVKDPETGATTETWETIYTYKNRYMLGKYGIEAKYMVYGGCSGKDYLWHAGVAVGMDGFCKEFNLPYSRFAASALSFSLEGSLRVFERKGHKLDLAVAVKGSKAQDVVLSVQEQNLYAEEVLMPDREYYAKDWYSASGSIVWQFPVNLGKAGAANGYVRLDSGLCKASPEGHLGRIGITVGLFTF